MSSQTQFPRRPNNQASYSDDQSITTGGFTPPLTVSSSSLFPSTFTMDKKPISQTLFGNMYQRFEAVFQEVDEFVNKDTVKYVETHMQSVGESVKKFYNGVLQDIFLPPLVETYKNSVTAIKENKNSNKSEVGLSIPKENCHKMSPTSEISESPVQEEEDTSPNPNFQHEGDELTNKTSFEEEGILRNTSSESNDTVFEDADWGIEKIIDLKLEIEVKIDEKSEKVFMETLISDEFESDLNNSRIQESSKTENENKEEKLGHNLLRAKSNDSSSTGGYISASSLDLSSCESFEDDYNNDYTRFDYSDFALYDESTDELDLSMVDFEDVDMDTIDLTESCVMVEGENVFSFPYESGTSKSYKKIIGDAFMSRKRLTNEYKQLAIWCGDIDKKISQQKMENATKSQVQDFHDSEWELL
ncbi:hypothetical protein L1887_39558 [Cichorium endivia]|nr:hypothetical protein L1887_39558 [Cichorium endivia]